jgi:GDP-D-mannose dehydratase
VSQIKGKPTVGGILTTGAAGCDGSLLVVRRLALGCEVVGADGFIGTYPRECKLHNLEQAASARGFRLMKGDYHDYHVVIHGTS